MKYEKKRDNRKSFGLILPKFQMNLIMFFTSFIVGGFIISFGIVNYYFFTLKDQIKTSSLGQDSVLYVFVDKEQFDLNVMLIVLCGLTIIATIVAGIWYSHRTAGALYRIIADLRKISNGDGSIFEIKVRKNDCFQELPEVLNSALRLVKNSGEKIDKAS